MYEHAYQIDYGAKAGDYVGAFMRVIHWTNPNILFAQYRLSIVDRRVAMPAGGARDSLRILPHAVARLGDGCISLLVRSICCTRL